MLSGVHENNSNLKRHSTNCISKQNLELVQSIDVDILRKCLQTRTYFIARNSFQMETFMLSKNYIFPRTPRH